MPVSGHFKVERSAYVSVLRLFSFCCPPCLVAVLFMLPPPLFSGCSHMLPPLSVLWLSSFCCPPPGPLFCLCSPLFLFCGYSLFVVPPPPSLSSGCSLMLPHPPLCSMAVLLMLPPSPLCSLYVLPSLYLACGCSLLLPSLSLLAVLLCLLCLVTALFVLPPSVIWLFSLCSPELCPAVVLLIIITICPPPSRLMTALPPVPIGGCLVNLVNLQYRI